MIEDNPESPAENIEPRHPDFEEITRKLKNRTPEEKRARMLEVARGAGLLSLENLADAGFYSKDEIHKLTWKMLNDPDLTDEQRQRVQALRKQSR